VLATTKSRPRPTQVDRNRLLKIGLTSASRDAHLQTHGGYSATAAKWPAEGLDAELGIGVRLWRSPYLRSGVTRNEVASGK
jgi:hypothetical protein